MSQLLTKVSLPIEENSDTSARFFSSRKELTPEWFSRAETLAFQYGDAYDSYLILERDRQFFFSNGQRGVVSFEQWRNNIYVVGGLLAADEDKTTLLDEFLEFTRGKKWNVHFLNIMSGDIPLMRARGFEITKTGEEAIVDLRTATWAGKDFAWVRQQENACARAGMTYREVDFSALDTAAQAALESQLREVSNEHVRDTVYGRELGLMVGKLEFHDLLRKRLFVAEIGERVEGFVVATPYRAGRVWGVETYRRRPTSPRGVVTFLIVRIARQLRAEPVAYLSLCQCPALRCENGSFSESPVVHRSMKYWWTRAPWFYDVRRLYHFKSRFRPKYRECFIAAQPKCRFVPMLMFGFKWGVVWPDLSRLPRHMLRRMKKWFHKETLADPASEPYHRLEVLDLETVVAAETPVASSQRSRKPR